MGRTYLVASVCCLWAVSLATSALAGEPDGKISEANASTYWAIVFSQQDAANRPRNAHTFATFVEVAPDQEIKTKVHISWFPAKGSVSILATQPVRGVNRTLEQDLTRAQASALRVSAWGPLRIKRELFENAQRRYAQLEAAESTGDILYKAVDGSTRHATHQPAINCVHAISDLAGDLVTGVRRGDEATALVVQHFDSYLVEPVATDGRWLVSALGLDRHEIRWRERPNQESPAQVTAVTAGAAK